MRYDENEITAMLGFVKSNIAANDESVVAVSQADSNQTAPRAR